jgi:hypothetical protein
MVGRAWRAIPALLTAAALVSGLAASLAGGQAPPRGYAASAPSDDTLRARLVSAGGASAAEHRLRGSIVVGYLSAHGLPPVEGTLTISDTGLVFRSTDGRDERTLPLVGPVRQLAQGRWRASAVSLAYVDGTLSRPAYLFRLDGGVFETEAPGALLEVAAHPGWLDSVASREWRAERPLVTTAAGATAWSVLDATLRGGYADSLYALFGRPLRPAGLVGDRGRAAGRLGEYIATRDSLALDPGRMTSQAQLRHTLAHELAHRWQARAGGQLALLWQGIPAIRDPRRYGFGNVGEHQAEAAAFAVHFLLSTATAGESGRDGATLDHYELLVPGTRMMARYFALQPIFARHPLRVWLTSGRLDS